MALLIITYLGISVAIAFLAMGRRISFAGALITSVFMSPFVGLIAILKSERNLTIKYYTTRYICPKCNFEYTEDNEHCGFCQEMGRTVKLEPTRILIQE